MKTKKVPFTFEQWCDVFKEFKGEIYVDLRFVDFMPAWNVRITGIHRDAITFSWNDGSMNHTTTKSLSWHHCSINTMCGRKLYNEVPITYRRYTYEELGRLMDKNTMFNIGPEKFPIYSWSKVYVYFGYCKYSIAKTWDNFYRDVRINGEPVGIQQE